jgi:hypothetical protein
LNSIKLIKKRVHEFLEKKINIVLSDRTVILATLVKTTPDGLEVLNMRQKRVKIPFEKLTEIYSDSKE